MHTAPLFSHPQQAWDLTETRLMNGAANTYRFPMPEASPAASCSWDDEHDRPRSVHALGTAQLECAPKTGWAIAEPSTAAGRRSGPRSGRAPQAKASAQPSATARPRPAAPVDLVSPGTSAALPLRIPDSAKEDLLSERMLARGACEGSASAAPSLLLPACLESRSGGAAAGPRLALRLGRPGARQVWMTEHACVLGNCAYFCLLRLGKLSGRLVAAPHCLPKSITLQAPGTAVPGMKPTAGNQREPMVVSLSDCSWDSDGPSHDPGHSGRDDKGLEPGAAKIDQQAVEDPEAGVRIRTRQAPARRQEAAQSSCKGESEDESPAAYAMPQRPARRGRLVQVVDSQTPQRPQPAAATPTLESSASLRTPQPDSGAPRARVRGRLVKRGVQLPGSCLKPAARKPIALPRPRNRARARSFLDDAAAVSGSDSGDDDADDGATESDLEGFVARDEDADRKSVV